MAASTKLGLAGFVVFFNILAGHSFWAIENARAVSNFRKTRSVVRILTWASCSRKLIVSLASHGGPSGGPFWR
jgi:hypothetical protein